MSDNNVELKKAIEDSNRILEAIRSEPKVDVAKFAKMEADLASALESKAAIETRLADVETKYNRPGGVKGADEADEQKSLFTAYCRVPSETNGNAMQTKADAITVTGDNTIAIPRVIASQVLTALGDASPLRGLSHVVSVGTPDFVEIFDRANAGTLWVGEEDERPVTKASDMAQIKPFWGEQHATMMVSNQARQDATFDLAAHLVSSATERFAAMENAAFLTGNGVNKPRGLLDPNSGFEEILTGSADGLGEHAFDVLIGLLYGVAAPYRTNGSFVMSSRTIATLARQKDANDNYLLTPAIAAGAADTIFGKRVVAVEDMPAVAAGAAPMLFGDLKRGYLIADRAGMSVIVDTVTRPGFTKFTFAKRVGGTSRDLNAVKIARVGV